MTLFGSSMRSLALFLFPCVIAVLVHEWWWLKDQADFFSDVRTAGRSSQSLFSSLLEVVIIIQHLLQSHLRYMYMPSIFMLEKKPTVQLEYLKITLRCGFV